MKLDYLYTLVCQCMECSQYTEIPIREMQFDSSILFCQHCGAIGRMGLITVKELSE